MTAIDRFDPFERRISEAIDEIADAGRPAYLDDILQQTARTSQRARWTLPERWIHMNRSLMTAAMALVVVVLAAGVYLGLRPAPGPGGTPQPSPSPTQSAAPAVAPESLRSTWLAETGPTASPGGPTSLRRLVINAAGDSLSVVDAGVANLNSRSSLNQSSELELTSTSTAGGCQIGDVGRYGFAFGSDGVVPNSDGTLLALSVVADSCAARQAALNRGWAHAIDADNLGGRGIATAFVPMFLITLPPAHYTASNGPDSVTATSTTPDRTLFAVHNPVGYADPCSTNGGSKLPIDPTIAAFTAYLRTLPGFTVQSTNLTIDGHPAVHLTVPSVSTVDCPSQRVYEWTSSDPSDAGGWHLNQGETDVIYLVEVDGNLVLLQWLGAGVTTAEEQALFATVRFTNTLPQ